MNRDQLLRREVEDAVRRVVLDGAERALRRSMDPASNVDDETIRLFCDVLNRAGMDGAFREAGEIEALRRKAVLTPGEAARLTPWTENSLQKMRAGGTGPAWCKVGGRAYYRLQDLEDFARAMRVKTMDMA